MSDTANATLCALVAGYANAIALSSPINPSDMLDLVMQSIETIQAEAPALERSIQEVKSEWNLP